MTTTVAGLGGGRGGETSHVGENRKNRHGLDKLPFFGTHHPLS